MTRQTPLTLLTGLGLVFIGSRFLLAPEIAEQGFGIQVANQGDFAFHTIKGIRELFAGLLIALLALTGQRKALAFCLLLGTLIPVTDGLLVLSRPEATTPAVLTHWLTAVLCAVTGTLLLVQPVFTWLARRATQRGRLDGLRSRYVPAAQSEAGRGGVHVANILLAVALSLLATGTFAQVRLSKSELSINAFRAPSIGLEYRHRAISLHGGYYLTNLTPNVTTRFVKVGLTGWFLPVGQRENPSSFYASVSYLRGLNLAYESQNAASAELGFRWVVWRGLNLRIGAIALAAEGKGLKINPTPGISYSFFFN